MFLNTSFDVFARSNEARPFQRPEKIAGFGNDPAFSSAFGLGGLLVKDTGELHITIGQRTAVDSLDFKTVVSGTLGVYRVVPDSDTDYLVQEVALQVDLFKKPRNAPWYWEIVVKSDIAPEELMLGCVLSTASTSHATWTVVESEERTRRVNYYTERFRTSQDVDPAEQPQVRVYVEPEEATGDFYALDFTKADNPLVTGSGNLTYAGGGNRYLINFDGETEQQQVDQAPWSVPAHLFIESSALNYFTDSALALNKHKVSSTASMITTKRAEDWDAYPGYKALGFSVSGPSALDSTWEFETEQVQITQQTLTCSLYLSCTNQSNRKYPVVVGLRYRSALNGAVVREQIKELGSAQIPDLVLAACTDQQTISGTLSYVSLFVQVKQLSPGDRFLLELAAPQLENTAAASSRIPSTTQRQADLVTFTPTDPAYDVLYGKFKISVFPAYAGVPGTALGDQYLFDTRDASGEAGFYAMHRQDGYIVFGLVGDTLSDTWVCTSTSVVEFVYGTLTDLDFWFDTNQMLLKQNNTQLGTTVFGTQFTEVPDQPIARIGRNYLNTLFFSGEVTKFSMSSEPTVLD